MNILLNGLVAVAFGAFVLLPSLYLAFLAAVTLAARQRSSNGGSRRDPARFAILVPAHNEEVLIGPTVAGLLALDYPKDRFAVHVIADNCADRTAAIARHAGANVHERRDPHRRGKGAALNWMIDGLASRSEPIDAFVIVDADSELSSDFLWAMSGHMRAGATVIQALNLVKVAVDRPLVRIRELALELNCHLRPLAHSALGGSSGLFGNGMCLRTDVCERYPWAESSVVEDAELFLRLVRDGHRIAFATDTCVRSVMPESLRTAGAQAVRWERGKFDHLGEAVGLVRRGLVRHERSALLAGLSGLTPPFSMLALATAMFLVASAVANAALLFSAALGALCALLFYVLRGAALGQIGARVLVDILLWAPLYCVWKVGVVGLAALGVGRGEWRGASRAGIHKGEAHG
jgi:cellulose synthase/poly-beta-1,6-N-acetylglucosamine synthase-like glycosyltransferase